MDLFLFTNFFPFKKAEPFLVNEFEFTQKNFDRIFVQSFYGELKDSRIDPTGQLHLSDPILPSPDNKKELLLRGIFNRSGFKYHLRDLFRQRLFLSPKKLYWFFISLLMTRLALSSDAYKKLVTSIHNASRPVLYFYWGDNLCWLIPYLKEKIKAKEVRIIIRLHRTDLYEDLKDNYAPLRQHIFSLADRIIPISEDGKKYLSDKYPQFKEKFHLSRLGVFDHGLNPLNRSDVKHIVSVSSVTKVKRVQLIFEALQKTSAKLVWHHFGDGPMAGELKELVQNKRKNLTVVLHGFVDNNDVMAFYKNHSVDLFLNVSASEGLPVSIMEALSFGVPVIATDTGGTSELVSDAVGRLIKVDFNTSDLATDIDKLLSLDTVEALALRKNARLRFESTVNASVNYTDFYRSVLSL